MIKKINFISVVIILSMSVCLFFLSYYTYKQNIDYKQDIDYLNSIIREQVTQIKEINNSSEDLTGGSESDPDPIPKDLGFVFPIHPDDFLYYTSPYGLRVSPLLNVEMKHNGVDIAATWRAQVVSIADGIVIEHYPVPGTPYPGGGYFRGHDIYGGMIRIDHGDFESLYAHLSWSRVRTGMEVQAGEVIGRVGSTGKSRGDHLHHELKVEGNIVNPLLYLPRPEENFE